MKNIGSVVRNPEIASLVPLLIRAITTPGENTKRALDALIHTSFTNVVDVPSLALVIPILTQAMRDRSSSTKKMAAQVIGGMCSLIAEPRSLMPYVPDLVKGVRSILTGYCNFVIDSKCQFSFFFLRNHACGFVFVLAKCCFFFTAKKKKSKFNSVFVFVFEIFHYV